MTTVPYTFGNEESPIPLSQLDANFAVTPNYANTAGNVVNAIQPNITTVGTLTALSVTGNVQAGNLRTAGTISATGTITVGNIATGGVISATGTVTGGNLVSTGTITGASTIVAAGTVTAGNVVTGGTVSATGNVATSGQLSVGGNIISTGSISTQGNTVTQGIISATGNIVTAGLFIGNFLGNITGNITGAPGSSTQILFNTAGNVDAVGGLTYNKGSNVFTVLGVISAQGNISGSNLTATGNISIGSNLTVAGATQLVGVVTGPTAPTGTANNQLATTVFVSNQINQYANNVAITGGTITISALVSNTSVSTGTVSASGNVTGALYNTATWTIREIGGALVFQRSGTNIARLDAAGNFTTIGNVTGFGTL
jgi:hypothetical protein